MLTVKLLRARLQELLARFERGLSRLLALLSAAVLFAAQYDTSWAVVLGKWGGLATMVIAFMASELRKGRPQP
jgi:hypothetical protein